MIITFKELINNAHKLASQIDKNKYKSVYGIYPGGVLIAYIISQDINIELLDGISKESVSGDILVVTDCVESNGEELKVFKELGFGTASVYRKSSAKYKDKNIFHPDYSIQLLDPNEEVYFPV
jgi:hypothetical protein